MHVYIYRYIYIWICVCMYGYLWYVRYWDVYVPVYMQCMYVFVRTHLYRQCSGCNIKERNVCWTMYACMCMYACMHVCKYACKPMQHAKKNPSNIEKPTYMHSRMYVCMFYIYIYIYAYLLTFVSLCDMLKNLPWREKRACKGEQHFFSENSVSAMQVEPKFREYSRAEGPERKHISFYWVQIWMKEYRS
jgi:hypothetical protein